MIDGTLLHKTEARRSRRALKSFPFEHVFIFQMRTPDESSHYIKQSLDSDFKILLVHVSRKWD